MKPSRLLLGMLLLLGSCAALAQASVRWNRLLAQTWAQAADARAAASAPASQRARIPHGRAYTLFSVAQYEAAQAAPAGGESLAVASASAAVARHFLTDGAAQATIAKALQADIEAMPEGAPRQAALRAGAEAAKRVLDRARSDGHDAVWKGTVPIGPGVWRSAPGAAPVGAAIPQERPWILTSAAQFRPAPPPAFGSPEFDAALDEVHQVARQRSAEQLRLAQRWAQAVPVGVWMDATIAALESTPSSERDAARVLAVMVVAMNDSTIACWDAKYHYWLLRPTQVDPALVLPEGVTLPNFPAYPSGHACGAGAVEAVVGHYLPQYKAEFARRAEEAAVSRLYASVHYRFDNEVGLALGRAVGRFAIEQEQRGLLRVPR